MTAFALKPTFSDKAGYLRWLRSWRAAYKHLSKNIFDRKRKVKAFQRYYEEWLVMFREASKSEAGLPAHQRGAYARLSQNAQQLEGMQQELHHFRNVAKKMMTLREEAVARKNRILDMQKEIAEQPFPLDLGACDRVDFHFNRGHNEFPFLPMWTIRAKGRSYYVQDVESNVVWKTHERENGSTKGVIRFPKCRVMIDKSGVAKILAVEKVAA